jgi:hypothetical protein
VKGDAYHDGYWRETLLADDGGPDPPHSAEYMDPEPDLCADECGRVALEGDELCLDCRVLQLGLHAQYCARNGMPGPAVFLRGVRDRLLSGTRDG